MYRGRSGPRTRRVSFSRTLIEHWNGSTWSISFSADPGNGGNILEGVAAVAPDHAWAVGARQDIGTFYQQPMAEHWDGATWTAVTVPEPEACTGHSYLTAVSALSARSVWATGWCGSGGSGPSQGYVQRWNGHRWHIVAASGSIPPGSQLYGITAAGARSVWVVGSAQLPGSSTVSALGVHWDGTAWTAMPVNAPNDTTNLQAVFARHAGPVWAVGAGRARSRRSPDPRPCASRPARDIRFRCRRRLGHCVA